MTPEQAPRTPDRQGACDLARLAGGFAPGGFGGLGAFADVADALAEFARFGCDDDLAAIHVDLEQGLEVDGTIC